MEKLNKNYNEDHWIRAYVYFRATETGMKWNQAKFDKIVRESISINKYRGLNQIVFQIEPYFIDKTGELFHRRDLTKQNSFDRMISDFHSKVSNAISGSRRQEGVCICLCRRRTSL